MARSSKSCRLIILAVLTLLGGEVKAGCISLVKGPIALDVNACYNVAPEKGFDLTKDRYKFIKDLPPKEQQKFYASYRGIVLKGRVARSQAVRSGLSPEKGALSGETISVFILPGQGTCQAIEGKRLVGTIDEACCEGGGDVPCLLSSSYVFKDFKTFGAVKTSVREKDRNLVEKSEDYKRAEVFFAKKDLKKAVIFYERARDKKELDIRGHYRLAMIYYTMDSCPKAIPVLRTVQDKQSANDFWADEEPFVRRSIFLLARCYSKENEPEFASVILNGYLTNPKKYRRELQTSLRHKDFGWIHTSKQYLKYEKDARKALDLR